MSFTIDALGTATPVFGISQEDATEIAQTFCCDNERQSRALAALYRRSGVRYRYSVALETPENTRSDYYNARASLDRGDGTGSETAVGVRPSRQSFFPAASSSEDCGPTTSQRMAMYERHAGELAIRSVDRAFENSSVSPAEITHLVTVSCTGFSAPGVDVSILRDCGLSASVQRTHIGFMGCHGALNGIRVAKSIADANPTARVLICAVELCTLHHQYGWHPERVVSNSLFADGAAALIGGNTVGMNQGARVVATGSTIVADTEDLMQWRIGDHGYEMALSPRVPTVIEQSLHPWLEGWLRKQSLSIQDIGGWAIHPGGPKILLSCGDALSFAGDELSASQGVLADYGNMSSPTVLFVLERLLKQAGSMPCVLLGFGPGLAIEATLIT